MGVFTTITCIAIAVGLCFFSGGSGSSNSPPPPPPPRHDYRSYYHEEQESYTPPPPRSPPGYTPTCSVPQPRPAAPPSPKTPTYVSTYGIRISEDDEDNYDEDEDDVDRAQRFRNRANKAGDEMTTYFKKSKAERKRGNRASADTLRTQGEARQAEMVKLHAQASKLMFKAHNKNRSLDEVDLHGQHVKEAIALAEDSLKKAKTYGFTEIRFIVGKGLHSTAGSKIKPAIQDLMTQRNLPARLDPRNEGVLIVRLVGNFLDTDEQTPWAFYDSD
ncbi:hypothetical protein BV25DRAFT_402265 [Artomyces pyxidatus]|uniref:Uncharacterized protein n=1 Tax=Artomyces pyxidatus TaxID=48021 RepID=A0ACB8T559_9AGAM|nr:hypothetical protein BV25DRAFT_402265 [Artomyces pyxidatus]